MRCKQGRWLAISINPVGSVFQFGRRTEVVNISARAGIVAKSHDEFPIQGGKAIDTQNVLDYNESIAKTFWVLYSPSMTRVCRG